MYVPEVARFYFSIHGTVGNKVARWTSPFKTNDFVPRGYLLKV
jgi:hypothetical protein